MDGNVFWNERIDGSYLSGRYCCILIAKSRKIAPEFRILKSRTTYFEGNVISWNETIRHQGKDRYDVMSRKDPNRESERYDVMSGKRSECEGHDIMSLRCCHYLLSKETGINVL